MAISAKQKQKKRVKKNQKRKIAKKSAENSFSFDLNPSSFSRHPIHECLAPANLFETGIGYVMFARLAPNGSIALSAFVVDVYCLGVKNALFKIASEYEYENTIKPRLTQVNDEQQYEVVPPSCARKLVEGAVSYAKNLGFSPHRDYKKIQKIFGAIDTDACPTTYTYGQDGKPFYISGPHESATQSRHIIDQLRKKCGDGNYHFQTMLDSVDFDD